MCAGANGCYVCACVCVRAGLHGCYVCVYVFVCVWMCVCVCVWECLGISVRICHMLCGCLCVCVGVWLCVWVGVPVFAGCIVLLKSNWRKMSLRRTMAWSPFGREMVFWTRTATMKTAWKKVPLPSGILKHEHAPFRSLIQWTLKTWFCHDRNATWNWTPQTMFCLDNS